MGLSGFEFVVPEFLAGLKDTEVQGSSVLMEISSPLGAERYLAGTEKEANNWSHC
jgi:hypothetical protein